MPVEQPLSLFGVYVQKKHFRIDYFSPTPLSNTSRIIKATIFSKYRGFCFKNALPSCVSPYTTPRNLVCFLLKICKNYIGVYIKLYIWAF